MTKPNGSKVGAMTAKMEVIEIESDTEEVGGKMLALCNEVNTSRELVNVVDEDGEAKGATSMQIVCVNDDYESDLNCDMEYMKFLSICSENGNPYLLEDSLRDDPPLRIMYNVEDYEESSKKKVKAGEKEKKRVGREAKSPAISGVSKREKTVLKTEKNKQKKGVALTKNIVERRKVGRPRKNPVSTENNLKVSKKKKKKKKKEKEKRKEKRRAKSQAIARAPKRQKTEDGRVDRNSISRTIPVVNTQRKKVEALRGSKIPVTKDKLEPMSTTSHAKACKTENEERMSFLDKSYAYYLAYLKSSITIFDADQQVKAVKDIVSLSDPDIVAVSDRPFADGGKSLFETNKTGKVIDVEDAIDIFNSSFSTKLMELLRKPYEKEDLVRLYNAASVNRPLTRSRQLRDGREIEYEVDHQFAPSLLDQYPDFEKKLSRHRKDAPRALNLLRGFLFYFENLTLDGAFKPWRHEEPLQQLCIDAIGCNNIECTPQPEALEY